jgi:DnaJ-class molecular chaperone
MYAQAEKVKEEIVVNCSYYNPVWCSHCHGTGCTPMAVCTICGGKGIFEYFDHPLDGSMYEMVGSEQ